MSGFLRYARSGYGDKNRQTPPPVKERRTNETRSDKSKKSKSASQRKPSARVLKARNKIAKGNPPLNEALSRNTTLPERTRIERARRRDRVARLFNERAPKRSRLKGERKLSAGLLIWGALLVGALTGILIALSGPSQNLAASEGNDVLLAARAESALPEIDAQALALADTLPDGDEGLAATEQAPEISTTPEPLEDGVLSVDEALENGPVSANAAVPTSIEATIKNGESLSVALTSAGIVGADQYGLISALADTVDLRAIRPGDRFSIARTIDPTGHIRDPLKQFIFKPKHGHHSVSALRKGEGFTVEKTEVPVTTKLVTVTGSIQTSLYDALIAEGETVSLVNRFVDMFQWDVDFYRETQAGDHFKIIVEKTFAEGKHRGYGKVLAAEFGHGGEALQAFNFSSKDGEYSGIVDRKGNARQRAFLKSPLEVARISSSYGQRFHPVLKRKKKHNGVDYGAARGTPFWAVAAGVVKEARYSRTAGNMVVIKHRNGVETEYFHATKFAPGIKPGVRVKQRQVIAYVGSTGRSTGPHLHFGMRRNGKYVDPGRQQFPSAAPMAKKYRAEYQKWVESLYAQLDALTIKS